MGYNVQQEDFLKVNVANHLPPMISAIRSLILTSIQIRQCRIVAVFWALLLISCSADAPPAREKNTPAGSATVDEMTQHDRTHPPSTEKQEIPIMLGNPGGDTQNKTTGGIVDPGHDMPDPNHPGNAPGAKYVGGPAGTPGYGGDTQNMPMPSQNFGANPLRNQWISRQTGYKGDFGGGQFEAWKSKQAPNIAGTNYIDLYNARNNLGDDEVNMTMPGNYDGDTQNMPMPGVGGNGSP